MRRAAELAADGTTFVEVGPGAVLAGLLRRIEPEVTSTSLSSADDVERFLS
jgi:malonyl CoA-acyl carrier protein transacylase